jgi:hypothetical protein
VFPAQELPAVLKKAVTLAGEEKDAVIPAIEGVALIATGKFPTTEMFAVTPVGFKEAEVIPAKKYL